MPHALIIEDNQDSIAVLSQLLKGEGMSYRFVSRPTNLMADDLEGVDIVFLDLEMPGMDGYEVFDILRQEYHLQMPIVAYTVNVNEMANARKLGFDGMLGKPIDPSRFADYLRRILQGESVWEIG